MAGLGGFFELTIALIGLGLGVLPITVDVSLVGVFMAVVDVAMRAAIMTVTGMQVSTVAGNDQCGVVAAAAISLLATGRTVPSDPRECGLRRGGGGADSWARHHPCGRQTLVSRVCMVMIWVFWVF